MNKKKEKRTGKALTIALRMIMWAWMLYFAYLETGPITAVLLIFLVADGEISFYLRRKQSEITGGILDNMGDILGLVKGMRLR